MEQSPPSHPFFSGFRWRVLNMLTATLLIVNSALWVWTEGFNWVSMLVLILGAITLGLELVALILRQRRHVAPGHSV